MANKEVRKIHAVRITCALIRELQELNRAGVTELANRLDHSKSTIFSHLRTLEEEGLVVQGGSKYRLSLRFLDVASHIRDQFPNYKIISTELESLAEETGEVAQFGIEEHGQVSYLYKATGGNGVETASSVGTQQPIHSTALGKVILADMDEYRVREIVEQNGLPPKTERTITDPDELFEALAEIRERGYAIDNEENVEGLRCIAAPLLADSEPIGAVSVSGPSSRFNDEFFTETLPGMVTSAANVIELNSKFS
jgi:DNA-binding IclR family transcriptional regulator